MEIKDYNTKEEALAAFKKSVELRRVWNDLVEGRMTREEFERKGYRTINIVP